MSTLRAILNGAQTLTLDPSPRLRELRMRLEMDEALRRAQWNRLSQASQSEKSSSAR